MYFIGNRCPALKCGRWNVPACVVKSLEKGRLPSPSPVLKVLLALLNYKRWEITKVHSHTNYVTNACKFITDCNKGSSWLCKFDCRVWPNLSEFIKLSFWRRCVVLVRRLTRAVWCLRRWRDIWTPWKVHIFSRPYPWSQCGCRCPCSQLLAIHVN